MTAHAMKGDRERCLEAGMDQYLSKPIRGKQIAEMFARLKLQPSAPAPVEELTTPVESAPENLIDWSDALESVDGDRELLAAVIEAFVEEAPQLMNQAKTAIENDDAALLHRTGHTLKGALLSFGGTEPSETAKKLEQLGASGTVDGADAIMNEFSTTIDAVVQELKSFDPAKP